MGVSLMFVTRVLTWQDALEEKSAWDTMIWIGLLIMLAGKLNEYGMVDVVREGVQRAPEGMPGIVIFILVAAIYFYIHYFFASATAHISALFPLSLALLIGGGVPAFPAAIGARRPEQHQRLPDAVRHRIGPGDVRRGLRHAGRVVARRLHHEPLPRRLAHDRAALVDVPRPRVTTREPSANLSGS